MRDTSIILAGFMGTGKTTVGQLLAQRLERPFVDLDARIEERAGKKISAIFAEDGEPRFRELEREAVREIAERRGLVVAVGGGAVIDPANAARLLRGGLLVCLTARPEVILSRVRRETHRPLLEKGDKGRRILELLEQRRARYEALPCRVDTSDLAPEKVADRILQIFRCGGASDRGGREKQPSETRLLEVAVAAVHAAGRHALAHRRRRAEVAQRLQHDVKLVLDLECQRKAEQVIRAAFPNHAILGEEGASPNEAAGCEWIVDPIDGTVNFSHGLPVWCSSVAVRRGGETVAGAVFAPELGDLYTATRSGAARRNGRIIRVSEIARPEDAILATGLAAKTDDRVTSHGVFSALARRLQRVRIMGAAAVDLCHVAAGRLEGYLETSIYLWDVAAAGLIVRRAGGRTEVLEDLGGHRMRYLATNGLVHEPLREVILQALRNAARAAPESA